MKKTRGVQLLCGMIMLLFVGLIYGWSVFIAPLEAEFGWIRSETSLIFTISMSCFCFGSITSGFLSRKRSHRLMLRVASGCFLAGFSLSSQVQTLWQIYLTYGVVCSFGVGLVYNSIMSTVIKWFPDRPGFCSGTLLLGFGVGAMLLGTGADILIGLFGWRITFIVLGISFAVVMLVGTQLIRVPTEEQLQSLPVPLQTSDTGEKNYSPGEMYKRVPYWLFFICTSLVCAIALAVIGQAVPIAVSAGATAALATSAAGLISVCNGLGRFGFGSVIDKIGRTKMMFLDMLIFIVSMPVIFFGVRLHDLTLLLAGFILLGIGYGGLPTMIAFSIRQMYGSKHYAINYSLTNLNLMAGSLIGPPIASSVLLSTGSYELTFPILLGLGLVALILAFFIKRA